MKVAAFLAFGLSLAACETETATIDGSSPAFDGMTAAEVVATERERTNGRQ